MHSLQKPFEKMSTLNTLNVFDERKKNLIYGPIRGIIINHPYPHRKFMY